ncbi:HD domain-containing protein [Mesoplasma syrphidae]|uniref:HD domain-containing protein n=1 Tax=Mesoplasma syrphidae TaxID=225999 RepID=A0A2K9BZY5_9MOLU|nr:HD domain-containing protein [Mesoplasma syrphidae]AUF83918.1 HD domain-containing protein [Mesoplasma syrphidae]
MLKLKDISTELNSVELLARVERVIVSTGSNGSNYMIVHLADATGRVEARKWVVTDQDRELIKPNSYIYFKEIIPNEFRGILQLKIGDYEIWDEEKVAQKGFQNSDFFVVAPVNIEKQYANLMELLEKVSNPTFKALTIGLIKKYEKEFLIYPAAMTIHHNVTGGLFWHSYTLVKNCLAIRENYLYAAIDWDLLICGAILHDIGKIFELVDQTATDYSLEGKLLGHISIGNAELYKMAEELNIAKDESGKINSDLTLLQHMILASHGKKEYGSPTEPNIIEAVILSTFDNLDARIFKINDELTKVEQGSWTGRILSEDGKMYLKHYKK